MKVSGNDGISAAVTSNVGYANLPQNAASKDVKKEEPIKIDISKEGREQYRKSLAAHNQEKMDLGSVKAQKNIIKHLSMDSDFESKFHKEAEMMSAAAREKGTTMSVQGKAENYFSAYAKMYDEIVQGYEAGTRETYVSEEGGYRKLTKEEELSALDKAFGKIAGDFEKRETINQNARNIIEEGFKKFAPYRKAKAGSTAAVAEKETNANSTTTTTEKESKETTSNVIEGISKKMINAADLFKAGYGKSDLATLLAGIKMFG
ncbi:MAG: hypothetical protein HDQ99_09755 [Lachnospiraceae bacterium]|nr:hypothetical protein [Lachnospiraceae bacterium]